MYLVTNYVPIMNVKVVGLHFMVPKVLSFTCNYGASGLNRI
jgi:hypothetical protein